MRRLRTKLILAFLFIAAIPVSISGYILVNALSNQVLTLKELTRHERLSTMARRLESNLRQVSSNLRLGLETFDLLELDPVERQGILQILYGQRSYLNALQLLDAGGNPMGQAIRLTRRPDALGPYREHVAVSDRELKQLLNPTLLQKARNDGLAWGPAVQLEDSPSWQLPMVLSFKRENKVVFFVSALLSASGASGAPEAMQEFTRAAPEDLATVYLLDDNDTVLLRDDGGIEQLLPVEKSLRDMLRGDGGGQLEYASQDGETRLVAWHPLSDVPWRVLSIQPSEKVRASVANLRRDIKYWMGVSIFIAVVFGIYFGRTLSTPIRELEGAALEIARGNLETRVEVRGADEIGKLAGTFNYMAGVLQSQKTEIERQSEEIRSWNLELQARVEARTRELKEAQGYLIHTQKLAAVAELGSGVAHELNNPLAAILGFTQILVARGARGGPDGAPIDEQEHKILRRIEEQTQRCRDIVHHLLRFSQEQIDRGAYDSVDLTEVVGTVLKLFDGAFASRKIAVQNALLSGELVSWGNRAQLLQAFLQLFSVIRTVLSSGQAFSVTGDTDGVEVRILITGPLRGLEGPGGDPFQRHSGQDQAMAQGLGLWLARKIFQEHQGGLEVQSVGEGRDSEEATWVIRMPTRTTAAAAARDGTTA